MLAPPATANQLSDVPGHSVDKTVLDRRASHRSTGSRLAMRDARREIQASGTEPHRFRDELLYIHAERVAGARWGLLGLNALAAACLALLLNPVGWIVLGCWFICALAVVLIGDRQARRFLGQLPDKRSSTGWLASFTAVQAVHGMLWAVFLLLPQPYLTAGAVLLPAQGLSAPLMLGVLLIVGAVHLTVSHALAGATSWIIVPPTVVVFALLAGPTAAGDGMAACVLIGAGTVAVTFSILGARLLGYARANVEARIEKDDAVLESEEARHLSEEARRRAEEANMAKTRFLATMSHELRTPLNAILGFSEIMQAQALGPIGNAKYAEYAGDIHSSGSHLLKLINEILDLSRVEAGRYELHEEPVDLVAVATDAMQMVKMKAGAKKLDLQVRTERDLPAVWADERAVRQVVLNFLSNAVKFTPTGGTVTVKVGWTGGGGQYVAVADTGPGIAEEEIPIVLSAFGQGSVALRSAEPGSGLGLPIVQAFMKVHDGKLDLKSRLREGTTVTAIFPRKRVMSAEPAARPVRPAARAA